MSETSAKLIYVRVILTDHLIKTIGKIMKGQRNEWK